MCVCVAMITVTNSVTTRTVGCRGSFVIDHHHVFSMIYLVIYLVLTAADQGMVTVVVLLDYSAAFDTVDHAVALEILEKKFGVSSSCLQWFCSYLSGRTFSVSANCQTSSGVGTS